MDAIEQLVDLFDNEEKFVQAFIERTLFFPPDKVEKHNEGPLQSAGTVFPGKQPATPDLPGKRCHQ